MPQQIQQRDFIVQFPHFHSSRKDFLSIFQTQQLFQQLHFWESEVCYYDLENIVKWYMKCFIYWTADFEIK